MPKPRTSSKPSARKRYHHGDLARELMQASLEILSEVGPEGLSLREAARRAGVNHRAIYRHYADKRTLLAAIAESGYHQLSADMKAAVQASDETPTRGASLLAISEAYLRFALREPARFQVMFGPSLSEDQIFASLEQAIRDTVAILAQELRKAGPEAPSSTRRDAGITLWSTMHGLSSLVLSKKIPLKSPLLHNYTIKVVTPVVDGLLQVLSR